MDGPVDNPWSAAPLSNAERVEKFQKTLTLHTHTKMMGRKAILLCTGLLGMASVVFVAAIGISAVVIATKDVKHDLWLISEQTGIISKPLSLADAAHTMPEAADRKALADYVTEYATWVWETDRRQDWHVKVMSTREQQARYDVWRQSPYFPGRILGKNGHVFPENLRFHREPDGKNDTRSYKIYFTLVTWNGTQIESSLPYTATIDFQWHPEMAMTPAERDWNPGGFLVLVGTIVGDTPDGRKM